MFGQPTLTRVLAVPLALVIMGLPVVSEPSVPKPRTWAVDLNGTGAVRAPADFAMVGVSWRAGRPFNRVAVRSSTDGIRWTPWQSLDADEDDGPDRGTEGGRARSTKPLWVAHGRLAQVRFEGARPAGAKVHFVDPGPNPRSTLLPAADASPARPRIISRAEWGADESIRRGAPQYAEPLKLAIVHHTATGNSYARSDSARIVRSIYAYHAQTNGWNDIGYSFLVDRYGQIFEGRAGGVTRSVVGAHSAGFNRHTAGIAVIGTFSSVKPPDAAMNALKEIAAWRLDQAYINPLNSTSYTSGGSSKWPAGQSVKLKNISGHRNTGNTECPGQPLYDSLPWLRSVVNAHGDPKVYTPTSRPIVTPNADGLEDTGLHKVRFSSTVSWRVDVIDGAGRVWQTTTGAGSRATVSWNGQDRLGALAPHGIYRFRINASNTRGSVRTTYSTFRLWRFPSGTLMRTSTGWTAILQGNKLRQPSANEALSSRYRLEEAVSVPTNVTRGYPKGLRIGFRDGTVVRADNKLWLISAQTRRPVSQTTLDAMRFNRNATINSALSAISPHALGDPLTATSGYPTGSALKGSDGREAVVVGGKPRPYMTRTTRNSYLIRDIDLAGPADPQIAQASGQPPVRFRDGTLLKTSSSSDVYVIEFGLRRRISSTQVFAALGYKSSNVRTVSSAELTLHPEGQPL